MRKLYNNLVKHILNESMSHDLKKNIQFKVNE